MIELDVSHTSDGELFVFHPGMEPVFLHSNRLLKDMTADEARKLYYFNGDGAQTQKKLSTFDEVLEHLKGRCYINVDKLWENVEGITGTIRRHGMADQILVKTAPDEAITDWLEQNAPEINYMLILSEEDRHSERMLRRHLNYVGVESLFARENCPIAGEKYAEWMRTHGLLRWGMPSSIPIRQYWQPAMTTIDLLRDIWMRDGAGCWSMALISSRQTGL